MRVFIAEQALSRNNGRTRCELPDNSMQTYLYCARRRSFLRVRALTSLYGESPRKYLKTTVIFHQ